MSPTATDVILAHGDRNGFALEETSDKIDAVNVLKANLKAAEQAAMVDKSKFDAEKDKTQFRQYEEACMLLQNYCSLCFFISYTELQAFPQHYCLCFFPCDIANILR